jgi:hypothetical protein
MTPPIELRLSAQKPRLLVGEGVVVGLQVRVLASVDLETLELNRNRTAIRVNSPNGFSRVFTGIDYLNAHGISPLSQIEDLFHAEAGAQWTVAVELLNFSGPLPVGRYVISLSYRYGDTEAESVATNPVLVEILPAELISAEYRWLGGATARDVLGSVWTARSLDHAFEQWVYQNADARNPGAVQFAAGIGCPAARPGARPVLAHLNDVHPMHFEKYVVWVQDDAMGYVKVHSGGVSGPPQFVKHGLGGDARLADPPLHRRDDGLVALVLGTGPSGQPACSVLTVESSGASSSRLSLLRAAARKALVLWPAEDLGAPLVYLSDDRGGVELLGGGRSGEAPFQRPVTELLLSQWMGKGTVGGCFVEDTSLRVFAMDSSTPGNARGFEEGFQDPGRLKCAALTEGGAVVSLLERDQDWAVLDHGGEIVSMPKRQGTPALVPAKGGVFLVYHDPNRGFIAERVGPQAPAPLV